MGVSNFLSKIIFKHRTITHTIWFALIFYWIYFLNIHIIVNYISLSITIGILLHIFEDALTISGVKPLYPIPLKIRFWKFVTNSTFDEFIINFIGYGIIIFYVVHYYF